MSNSVMAPATHPLPQVLVNLTSRLTIGSAVCFSEGILASIIVMVPRDERFFLVSTLLTFAIWGVFWCFRESKLGADIGDLCFWDLLAHSLAFICYAAGIDPIAFWYMVATISVLKLIRVYLWQTSETQQHGWGIFGPMTWYHAKHHLAHKPIFSDYKLKREIIVILLSSVATSLVIRLLPDAARVAAIWIVPFAFEFFYGPLQLRNLKVFNNLLSDSTTREATLAAENAALKAVLDARIGGDPKLNDYVTAYLSSSEEMRDHLAFYAGVVANEFPTKKAANG